jgi:hypothetical protein
VVAHLLAVPARADAQEHTSAGERVERGDLLRRLEHVPLREKRHRRAEGQRGRRRRRRRQRDERIEGAVIDVRQLAAARPRRLTADGDVRVLREQQRLEAALLQGPGEDIRADALGGHEGVDTELHATPPVRPARYPIACSV